MQQMLPASVAAEVISQLKAAGIAMDWELARRGVPSSSPVRSNFETAVHLLRDAMIEANAERLALNSTTPA
jgi:hypothetical protein